MGRFIKPFTVDRVFYSATNGGLKGVRKANTSLSGFATGGRRDSVKLPC